MMNLSLPLRPFEVLAKQTRGELPKPFARCLLLAESLLASGVTHHAYLTGCDAPIKVLKTDIRHLLRHGHRLRVRSVISNEIILEALRKDIDPEWRDYLVYDIEQLLRKEYTMIIHPDRLSAIRGWLNG